MNELREAIATVLEMASQMIDELDDDMMMALAELLNAASERLTEMEQEPEGPIGGPGPRPDDITPAMPSSNVEGFAYDDKTGRMLVRFLGKYPDKEGPIYGYEGIPKNIFEIFRKGGIPAKTNGKNKWGTWWQGKYPSIGAAMYHLIRAGNYPYQRLS
jgi:KTSC domain